MIGKPKRKVTEARPVRPVPTRPRIPVSVLIRMFVIGSVAVIASIWAIWRHYTAPHIPMVVPTPSTTATEIEVEP